MNKKKEFNIQGYLDRFSSEVQSTLEEQSNNEIKKQAIIRSAKFLSRQLLYKSQLKKLSRETNNLFLYNTAVDEQLAINNQMMDELSTSTDHPPRPRGYIERILMRVFPNNKRATY